MVRCDQLSGPFRTTDNKSPDTEKRRLMWSNTNMPLRKSTQNREALFQLMSSVITKMIFRLERLFIFKPFQTVEALSIWLSTRRTSHDTNANIEIQILNWSRVHLLSKCDTSPALGSRSLWKWLLVTTARRAPKLYFLSNEIFENRCPAYWAFM